MVEEGVGVLDVFVFKVSKISWHMALL